MHANIVIAKLIFPQRVRPGKQLKYCIKAILHICAAFL